MILAQFAGDHMGRFVEGTDRGQTSLFPECLEDWICEDNPVRVIEVFVEELDLAELGFSGARRSRSHGPTSVSSIGPSEALHIRLSQSRSVEPPT
jgi:hypothetical protein